MGLAETRMCFLFLWLIPFLYIFFPTWSSNSTEEYLLSKHRLNIFQICRYWTCASWHFFTGWLTRQAPKMGVLHVSHCTGALVTFLSRGHCPWGHICSSPMILHNRSMWIRRGQLTGPHRYVSKWNVYIYNFILLWNCAYVSRGSHLAWNPANLITRAAQEISLADLTLSLKASIWSWKSPRVDTILVNNMGPEQCLHDM